MAHLRFYSAHWPEPLTAPGAAQACSMCLPSPANQQTSQGDSHPDRPIERAVRSAPVPSQFGGFTRKRPAFSPAPGQNFAPDALNCGHCSGRRALRFLDPSAIADAAMQRSFSDFSGSIRPFLPSSLSHKPRLWAEGKGGGICLPCGVLKRSSPINRAYQTPKTRNGLVSSPCSHMAHLRFCSAHCSHPATAPRAAQACPLCLPSGSNQPTGGDDLRLGRPVEKSFRFAFRTSQLGSFIPGTARSLACLSHIVHFTDRAVADSRTCEICPPICHFAAGVSGFPAPANRFGQIGAPVMTTGIRVVHLNGPAAALPIQINALTSRPAESLRLLDFSSLMSVPCSGRQGLRPLAPPFLTEAAHQLTFPASSGSCRPLEKGVRFAADLYPFGDFTEGHTACFLTLRRIFAPVSLICGSCPGRQTLRPLASPACTEAANQRTFPRPSGSFRPFSPSSPAPNSRLRTQRKGVLTSFDLSTGVLGNEFRASSNNPAQQIGLSYLRGHFPGSNDRQDSTFSRKKCGRVAVAHFPPILRVSGTLRRKFPFFQPTTNPHL